MKQYVRFDWAMKKLLRDKTNFVVLEGFISTLLEKDIHITQLLESESNQDYPDDKQNRVDIAAQDDEGAKYIIEVQAESEVAYFQRIIFGTSRLVRDYLRRGSSYGDIKKVYSINIVYFNLGQGDDYVYRGTTEFRGVHTGDILSLSPFQREKFNVDEVRDLFPEYYILKVNGFNDVAKTPLEEWIQFLKNETIPENPTAKGLAEAKKVMDYNHMSDAEKEQYEKHLDNIVVLKDNILTARGEGRIEGRIEGREEGIAEGREEEKIETARRMLQKGFDIDTITEISGLTKDEIQQL